MYYLNGCLACMYVCGPYVCRDLRGKKRILDPLGLKLQMPCGCWASNLGPLEDWPVLSIPELSHELPPQTLLFFKRFIYEFYVCEYFICMCICTPENSSRQARVAKWAPGIELRTVGRRVCTFNHFSSPQTPLLMAMAS